MRWIPCLLSVACLQLLAQEADHAIRLSRPSAVGNRYQVTAKGSSRMQARIRVGSNPLPVNEDAVELSLQYEAEVLELDARKQPARIRIILGPSLCTRNGAAYSLPAEGTRLEVAEKEGKTVVTRDGEPVSDVLTSVLTTVISMSSSGASDDDLFGTPKRMKVGESWPVNSRLLAAELGGKQGIEVDPDAVQGKATLLRVVKDQGRECLQVVVDARVGRIRGMQNLPDLQGLKVMKSEVRVNLDGLFPLEPALERQRQSGDMYMEVVLSGKAGNPGQEMPVEAFITASFKSEESQKVLPPARKPGS